MIFFRPPELRRRLNLRYHWPAKTPARIDFLPRRFRHRFLLGRVIKNHRAILRSNIGTLPVQSRGIVVRPENIQKFIVCDLRWVEFHLHDLDMPRLIGANIFVGWILFCSTGVADCSGQDALRIAERLFDPPKAACAKSRFLRSHQKQNGMIMKRVQPSGILLLSLHDAHIALKS